MSEDDALCKPLAKVYSKYWNQGPMEIFDPSAFPASGPVPVDFNGENQIAENVDIYNDGKKRSVAMNWEIYGSGAFSGSVLTIMSSDKANSEQNKIDLEAGLYNVDPHKRGYVLAKYPGCRGPKPELLCPKLQTNIFESLVRFRGITYLVGREINFDPRYPISRIAVMTLTPPQHTTDICYMTLIK